MAVELGVPAGYGHGFAAVLRSSLQPSLLQSCTHFLCCLAFVFEYEGKR